MSFDYIKQDLAGYPFNSKYPPNSDINGSLYHGYRNSAEETFFYDFAVQRYNLRFTYNGQSYYFLCTQNYAAQCDETFCQEIRRFEDCNSVLEHFLIDGKRLIDLISQIEDCEPM